MPLTFTKLKGQQRNEPGSSVMKITASALWMRFALQQSFGWWRENKQNAGRQMSGGLGVCSCQSCTRRSCSRRSSVKLAPSGPGEKEMLLLLDILCHTEVMGLVRMTQQRSSETIMW